MTDIIERLRAPDVQGNQWAAVGCMIEAADEIKRLTARLFPPGGPPADLERDHLAEQCETLLQENERLRRHIADLEEQILRALGERKHDRDR